MIRLGVYLANGLQYKAFITDHQLYALKAAFMQPLEKANPTGLILFHTLGSAQNLAIALPIDTNGNQNAHVFELTAPVAFEVDPIHIDIRVFAAMKYAISPVLNMDVCPFLFSSLMADGDTLVPKRASVISSTRRADTLPDTSR